MTAGATPVSADQEGMLMDGFEIDYPDAEEERPSGKSTYKPLPTDWYLVSVGLIKPRRHIRGPMFGLQFKVAGNSQYANRWIWGSIIFLPWFLNAEKKDVTSGAGIARAFLKAIGEPYKGENLKINPKNWRGRLLSIKVIEKEGRNNVKSFRNEEEHTGVSNGTKSRAPESKPAEPDADEDGLF